MIELLSSLLPILLVDIVNPVLFAILIAAAGQDRPVLNSTMVLAGHTLAYFVGGIVAAGALETIQGRLANPQRIDYLIGGLVGAALVAVFFATRRGARKTAKAPEEPLTPWSSFTIGAIVNLIGIPFALPYFAAISLILKADVGTASQVLALATYNLLYMLPYLIVPIGIALRGDAIKPLLNRVASVLEAIANRLLPWMLLTLGIVMIADAAKYFLTGTGLY